MTLNSNYKKTKSSNLNATRTFEQTARLLGYKKVNTNENSKNIKKTANLNRTPQSWEINWEEIETRDSDSIISDNVPKKTEKQRSPKLYTFYDYINKRNRKLEHSDKLKTETQSTYHHTRNKSENSPEYIYKLKQDFEQDSNTFVPETSNSIAVKNYNKMPISSGFGGYTTTTTRRKNQGSNQRKTNNTIIQKSVIKNESDDELPPRQTVILDEAPMQLQNRTIIVDSEPEEEIVHVIHKPKSRKSPKEQIIYVDEEDDNFEETSVNFNQKVKSNEIVYVRSPSPKVLYSKERPSKKIIYTMPQKSQKQKVIYVKDPTQTQYIYSPPPEHEISPRHYVYPSDEYNYQTDKRRTVPSYVYYESVKPEKKIMYIDD